MKTTPIKQTAHRLAAVLSFALALCAATTAEAARYWKGDGSNNQFGNSGNWGGNGSGRRYFFKDQLTGKKYDTICVAADNSNNIGLCFGNVPDSGVWSLNGYLDGTIPIHTLNNSGGSDWDNGLICVGYSGQSSKALFYAVNLKTRHFTIGGAAVQSIGTNGNQAYLTGDMTGSVVLDDKNGAVTLEATKVCGFYKGSLYATNATLTCGGNMMLETFTLEKTGGDWTLVNGDLILGNATGSSATFTQNSGTVTVANNRWTKSTSGNGTLNLNGGTFVTQHLQDETAGGSLTVNIDGGTIKANNAHASGLISHGNGEGLNVNVGANGGTIDTDGRDISIHVAVNAVENTAGAFTVTGGGSATFSAMGNLAGALTVGDNTALHWFDQDVAVSATCGFTSLALGAGSTIYLDGDATGVDALPATATTTATAASKANIVINFSAIPATGASFTLFPSASADVFNVTPMFGSLVLPHEVAVVEGNLVLTIVAEDYTWNGSQTNWGDDDAWTKGGAVATWSDGNNAIFNTANATATLAADASPAKIDFTADATVDGTATLSVPDVVGVSSDVTATINAPIVDTLVKTGAGTLVLGSSRTEQTTVSEGTLAMANGATVDPANLTLGTDPEKSVVFDYAGQKLTANPTVYLGAGMDVTLANGVFTNGSNITFANDTFPKVLTIADGATLQTSGRYNLNTSGEATINIAGGTLKSDQNNNNWAMQASYEGCLNINLTDKGLLEFGGEVYMLTCRDGDDAYKSPELHISANDSTIRVGNGKSIRFGRDDSTKSSAKPVFSLAASNSTFDIGYGIYLGNDKAGLPSEGKYTAAFEDCVITARQFCVYSDRTLNNASFNGTRLVFNTNDSFISAADGDAKWITVGGKGLTIDTQAYTGSLRANFGGTGPVAKVGAGTLEIRTNQTASAALNVNEGTIKFARVCTSCARALSLAGGTTVDVSGESPVELGSLTLPASGTMTLTNGGAAFAKGVYRIFSCDGLSALAVQDKLLPSIAEGEQYSWSVEDGVLVLNVGNLSGNAWTGFAGDGKMSSDANWLDGSAPVAGDAIDFSGVSAETTIDADIDAKFGAVTMGDAVVTFTGSLAATSFSDTSKVAVGENSTVTIDGDLMFGGEGTKYAVYRVNAGGEFIVTGTLGAATGSSGIIIPQASVGGGIVVGREFVNNGDSGNIYACANLTSQKWAVGANGLSDGTLGLGWWCLADASNSAYFYPYDNDFTVSAMTCIRSSFGHYELNTTGWHDKLPHTITLDAGYSDSGKLFIAGTGKVIVNHTRAEYGGYKAYSGAVTVSDTATLAINPGKQLTSGTITFNGGTTLELSSTGVVETGKIAFGNEATVTLKVTGESALAVGQHTILTSSSALPSDVVPSFALDATTVKGANDAWLTQSGDGKSLVLNIGDRAAQPANTWVGGNGSFSKPANWANGVLPTAGSDLDFSGASSAVTVNADIDAAFGAVTMGDAVVTFTGALTATSFSDNSKVEVGANSTVTLDGDLEFTSGDSYITYKVGDGGAFVVTGTIRATGSANVLPYKVASPGWIVAKGLENAETTGDKWNFRLNYNNVAKWVVGKDGFSGTQYFWSFNNANSDTTIKADADFTIATWLSAGTSNGKGVTFDTSGRTDPAANYTITADYGFVGVKPLTVKGGGTFLCNYVPAVVEKQVKFSGAVTVDDTATLAINPGKYPTTGAITVNSGATLEVAQSDTVTLGGNLTLKDGATLGFNYTTLNEPVLALDGKTVTFDEGETTNVVVKVTSSPASVRARAGTNVLTSGGGFADATISLAEGTPRWVKDVSVNEDGNIVLEAKPFGLMFILR